MPEEVFLTVAPLYAHFRQTPPEYESKNDAAEETYLLREFDGQRYTSRLSDTILTNSVRLQKALHQAMRVKLTELKQRAKDSESSEMQLLQESFDGSTLIEEFDLSLGRVDRQVLDSQIDDWREAAIEYDIEPVIKHLEEYLTGQSDIPDQPANRLRLRYVPAEPSSVMSRLKSDLGRSTGAIVATGVKWYDNRAEGLDMAEHYPIVSVNNASEYEQQSTIIESIRDAKDSQNYTPPKIVCVTDIDT